MMVDKVHELRPEARDREKITVNLGDVDLGRSDLPVAEGCHANRTDFLRIAVRQQLDRHGGAVQQSVARKGLELGLLQPTGQGLEAARRGGEMLHLRVPGLASIAANVTPELATATIASVTVPGVPRASPAVKAAQADWTG